MKESRESAMTDLLSRMKEKGVILYGAGRIGKETRKQLEQKDVSIVSIWDENASNMSSGGMDDRIRYPDYDYENKSVYFILCIFSEIVARDIEKRLRAYGFCNIYRYDEPKLLSVYCDGLIMSHEKCNRCVVSQGGCQKYIKKIKKDRISYLNINRLNLSAILKCTLNCRNCCQHMAQYKKANKCYSYSFEKFSFVWEKIEKVFGWIDAVQLLGGEFFLHENYKDILNICVQSEHVGVIIVITNGIHHLKKEDIEALVSSKIVVLVDDYTTKLNERQKEIFEHTIEDFKRYGVNYLLLDNTQGTWYDYGCFEANGLKGRELAQLYKNCTSNACYGITWDYSFSICGRARIASDLGYVDTTKDDCIDLLYNDDVDDIREKIRRLCEKEYLEICKYCAGNKYMVPAGEQMNN